MASLDIVIVNWNTAGQLRECLESVMEADKEDFQLDRIVVVDNASSDGSASGLEDLGLDLSVLYNHENRGFAAACNQGAEGSSADYLLFLNPDTALYGDSLSVPISFMERGGSESTGVVGIQLIDENGEVGRTCARFPTPARCMSRALGLGRLFPRLSPAYLMTNWDHGESRYVDHVTGAFFLVRSSLFVELGGFDERFFVYLEDMDFSYRLYLAGWKSYYLSDARIFHRGGGASEGDKARRIFYAIQSRILYSFKHFSKPTTALLIFCSLVIEPVLRILSALLKGSKTQLGETLEAYIVLWKRLPGILHWMQSNRYDGR